MPIGVVSDELFELEIKRNSLSNTKLNVVKPGVRTDAVPHSIRKLVAEEALQGTPSKVLEETFGIRGESVQAYKNGATNTNQSIKNRELNNFVETVRDRISDKANGKILRALKFLDDDKLKESSARELSGVAKDMASVVEKMSPVKEVSNNQVHIHLHAPEQKDIKHYEVIDV